MMNRILSIIAPPVPRIPRIELYLGAVVVGTIVKLFYDRASLQLSPEDLKPDKSEPYWETLK